MDSDSDQKIPSDPVKLQETDPKERIAEDPLSAVSDSASEANGSEQGEGDESMEDRLNTVSESALETNDSEQGEGDESENDQSNDCSERSQSRAGSQEDDSIEYTYYDFEGSTIQLRKGEPRIWCSIDQSIRYEYDGDGSVEEVPNPDFPDSQYDGEDEDGEGYEHEEDLAPAGLDVVKRANLGDDYRKIPFEPLEKQLSPLFAELSSSFTDLSRPLSSQDYEEYPEFDDTPPLTSDDKEQNPGPVEEHNPIPSLESLDLEGHEDSGDHERSHSPVSPVDEDFVREHDDRPISPNPDSEQSRLSLEDKDPFEDFSGVHDQTHSQDSGFDSDSSATSSSILSSYSSQYPDHPINAAQELYKSQKRRRQSRPSSREGWQKRQKIGKLIRERDAEPHESIQPSTLDPRYAEKGFTVRLGQSIKDRDEEIEQLKQVMAQGFKDREYLIDDLKDDMKKSKSIFQRDLWEKDEALLDKEEDIGNINKKLSEAIKAKSEAEDSLQDAQTRLTESEKAFSEIQEQKRKLQENIAFLEAENERKTELLGNQEGAIESQRRELEAMNAQLETKIIELEHTALLMETWKDKVTQEQDNSNSAQNTIEELKRRVLELENDKPDMAGPNVEGLRQHVRELEEENVELAHRGKEMTRMFAARERNYNETEKAWKEELANAVAKASGNEEDDFEPGSGTQYWDDDHPKDYCFVNLDGKKTYGWEARYEAVSHKLWAAASEKQAAERAAGYMKDDNDAHILKIYEQGLEVKRLEAQNAKQKNEYAELANDTGNLIQQLRDVIKERNAHCTALETQVSVHEEDMDSKEVEQKSFMDIIAKLKATIVDKDRSLAEANQEIDAQSGQLSQLFNELQATEKEQAPVAKQIAGLKSELEDLNENFNRIQNTHKRREESSEKEIQDLRAVIEELQKELDGVHDSHKEANERSEKEIQAQRATIGRLQKEQDHLNERSEKKAKDQRAIIDELREERDHLNERSEKKIKDQRAIIEDLQEEQDRLNERSERELKDQRAIIEDLQKERDRLNEQLKRHQGSRPGIALSPKEQQAPEAGTQAPRGESNIPGTLLQGGYYPLELPQPEPHQPGPHHTGPPQPGPYQTRPQQSKPHKAGLFWLVPHPSGPKQTNIAPAGITGTQTQSEVPWVPTESEAKTSGPFRTVSLSSSNTSHFNSSLDASGITESNEPDQETPKGSGSRSWLSRYWKSTAGRLFVENGNLGARNDEMKTHLLSDRRSQSPHGDTGDDEVHVEAEIDKEGNIQRAEDGTLPDPVGTYRKTSGGYGRVREDLLAAFGTRKERIWDEEDQA